MSPISQLSSGVRSAQKLRTARPLAYRFGELILLFLFLSLLAGRFSLTRIDNDAVGIDLRFIFVYIGVLLVLLWWSGTQNSLPGRVPMVGTVAFTFWCLWMVASAAWAPQTARINETMLDFGFLFSLIILAWFVMSRLPKESLERVWAWLLVTGMVYFVLAMLQGPGAQGRFSAPGGGPNTFVRIMVVASIAALYLAVVHHRNWVLFCIPIFAVGAALSGSRGGLASAVVVLIIFLVPVVRRLGVRKVILVALFLITGAVIILNWGNGYLTGFFQERFIQQTILENYSSGRDEISEQAWMMFNQNPLIGVGLDGFYVLQNPAVAVFEHPHNLVLATLAEAGIIGCLLLIAALTRLVSSALGKRMPASALFALITGLYYFSTAMFSGDYYDSRFVWFFLGLAVINMTGYGEGRPPLLGGVPQGQSRKISR